MNRETIKYKAYKDYIEGIGELDLLDEFEMMSANVQSWLGEDDTIADAIELEIENTTPTSSADVISLTQYIKDFVDTEIEFGRVIQDDFRTAIVHYHFQAFEANIDELIFNCVANMVDRIASCTDDVYIAEDDIEALISELNINADWTYGDIEDAVETYINEM